MNKDPRSNGQLQTHRSDNAGQDVPLHERLPLEIFIAVMHLCVGSTTPVRDLVTLQLVCHSWHDIIAGASFLWGALNAAEGLPAVRKALKMAKNSLLDLHFTQHSTKIDQAEFFKLARERVDQWRSFIVETRQWESALDDLRAQKPPKLDTLHVAKNSYVLWEKEEIVLFGGEPALGLKDVQLVHVPISRVSLHLSGLKSLRLEGISSVSAAEVITLITESLGLEILHLVSLDGAVLPTHPTPGKPKLAPHPPIKLPFLIEMNLFDLNLLFQSYLLSNVAFPRLRSLRVGCKLEENPALQLGATLGLNRLDPSIKSIASGAQMYKVTLSSWGYYAICIGGLDIQIAFFDELSMDHFLETFTWLSGHLEQSLHELPLHLNIENCDSEPWYLEWFTGFTNVTTLTLYSDPFYGPSLKNLIQILSQPKSPSPSQTTWLLPQVEVLHSSCVWTCRNLEIVDMIEGRHSAIQGSFAAEANGALPKRFREVWLAYHRDPAPPPDTEFLSKVMQAADGADVYWEGRKWIVS